MSEKPAGHRFVKAAVLTTSGRFPDDGFERVPQNQPVKVLLQKAAKALELSDTEGWVARVDDRDINPGDSYEANELCGEIVIDWGPSEGGGGA